MVLIHNLAEEITCSASSVRLRIDIPFAISVSSAYIGLDGAPLPRRSVIEDSGLETWLEQLVRRDIGGLAVPLAPVRESSGRKLVGLDHFLGRGAVSAAFLAMDGVIASRSIVVVEAVGYVIGTAEKILENDFLVSDSGI